MSSIDLHNKPFDISTIAKLEIFEDYAEAWIPTFVMQGRQEIHIFDFFAGTGYDKSKTPGSSIRILKKIKKHIGNIFQKGTNLTVHLNEYEPENSKQEKFELLKESCKSFLQANQSIERAITIQYHNINFESLFPKLLPVIAKFPSLVYLDQNGVKYLSSKYLLELEKCKETDFLYFVSSSYFRRFGESDEFSKYLPFDIEAAKNDPYKLIHKNVLKALKQELPINTKLKLYPYSLKKGSNIYGIIFGASHPRAVDKFLTIAWKRNRKNGEANFDINDEDQPGLFNTKKPKIQAFQDMVESEVLSGRLKNNYDLFNYSLDNGHIGKHAAERLQQMKKEKKVTYDGKSPLVTYQNVYKKQKILEYVIIHP